jgi:hypothetical protein
MKKIYFYFLPVWIGNVSMLIRIRIRFYILMLIQIWIWIRILPQVIHKLEMRKFVYFCSQQFQFTLFYLSHQCRRCHKIFSFLGRHLEIC